MRISDWSSDVCSSDLHPELPGTPMESERIEKLHLHFPEFAARYVDLYNAHMRANERINMIEEAIANDHAVQARLPWEAARDWFHEARSEEHTSELQSLMRISYAVFCLKKKNNNTAKSTHTQKKQNT